MDDVTHSELLLKCRTYDCPPGQFVTLIPTLIKYDKYSCKIMIINMREFHHTVESFNFVVANLWGLGFIVDLWGYNFMDASAFSFSWKTKSFKIVFVKDVNLEDEGYPWILMIPEYSNFGIFGVMVKFFFFFKQNQYQRLPFHQSLHVGKDVFAMFSDGM